MQWTGKNIAQCVQCGQVFTTVSNFDKHQKVSKTKRAEVKCLEPASVGLIPNDRGMWRSPNSRFEE